MIEPGVLAAPAAKSLTRQLARAAGARRQRRRLRRGEDSSEVRAALVAIVQDGVHDAAAALSDDAEEREHFVRVLLERDRDAWPLVNGSFPEDLAHEVCDWVAWTLAPPGDDGTVPAVGPEHPQVGPLCTAIMARLQHWALRSGGSPVTPLWQAFISGIRGQERIADEVSSVSGKAEDRSRLFDVSAFSPPLTDLSGESLFDILQFKRRVVPFIGGGVHERLVAQTVDWARSGEKGLEVGVVNGAAGTGKSRLCAEVCDRLAAASPRWSVGFADYSALASAPAPERATLLVCDYPERHPSLVGDFLARLWSHSREGRMSAPVRVLLVSRHQESWYEAIQVRARNLGLITTHRVDLLPGLLDTSELRRHADTAFAAFCDGFRIPEAERPVLEVNPDAFDRPLLAHIAALLAAWQHTARSSAADAAGAFAGDGGEEALLDDLIAAEVERLMQLRIDGAHDGPRVFVRRTEVKEALCVTSLTAPLRGDLPDLLACTESFGRNGSGDRVAAADALLACFPAGARASSAEGTQALVAPVEPDLIAARLLATTPGRSQIVNRLVASEVLDERPEYHAQLVGRLALAADDYPGVATDLQAHLADSLSALIGAGEGTSASLAQLLIERLSALVDTAVELASSQDLTAVRRLAVAVSTPGLADHAGIDEAAAVALDRLPYPHPVMSGLGVALAVRAVAHCERRGSRQDLAETYNTFGIWLGDQGRANESLAAVERSVSIFEELADRDRDVHLPDLVISINSHALRLAAVGRRQEALSVSERAVAICEELAAGDRNLYLPNLATSVNNHAVRLAESGRLVEALAVSGRAVALREELVENEGDAYLPYLADSLDNLAVDLAEVGRHEEALAVSERAMGLYEEFAANDRNLYLPDLAISVNNYAIRLAESGRLAEALAVSGRSVALREELVESNRAANLPGLAKSLWTAADVRQVLGTDISGALVYCNRSILLYQELAEAEPDAFGDDLTEVEALREILSRSDAGSP